jgi:hypothetical protein
MSIRSLISDARKGGLAAGQVLEFHDTGEHLLQQGITTADDFARRWGHAADGLAGADPGRAHVGLVHDTGALLAEL